MGFFDAFRRSAATNAGDSPAQQSLPLTTSRPGVVPRWMMIVFGVAILAIGYWGIVGAIISDTDADLTLRPSAEMLPAGGSVAVGTAALLLDDAVNVKGWTPNDSIFRPTALLEDMPAFQRGEHGVIAAFTSALDEGVEGDPELAEASGALDTPPSRGWFHGDFPFVGSSAESNYLDAAAALTRFNRALADSGAPFGSRRQLRLALVAIDRALSERIVAVDKMVDDSAAGSIDIQYHEARGSAYASTMLLRGLREDFEAVIGERQLAAAWAEAGEALDEIASKDPFSIGRGDLVEQGYFLLRARASLRAITAGAAR